MSVSDGTAPPLGTWSPHVMLLSPDNGGKRLGMATGSGMNWIFSCIEAFSPPPSGHSPLSHKESPRAHSLAAHSPPRLMFPGPPARQPEAVPHGAHGAPCDCQVEVGNGVQGYAPQPRLVARPLPTFRIPTPDLKAPGPMHGRHPLIAKYLTMVAREQGLSCR